MGKKGNNTRKEKRRSRRAKEAELLAATATPSDVGSYPGDTPWDDGSGDFSPWNTDDDGDQSAPEWARNEDKNMPVGTQIKVTVMKDHTLEYPDLFMKIFLVGKDGNSDALFAQLFARSGCQKASSMAEADLVVFVGGPDVDPDLYGEERHPTTHINKERDTDDINAYLFCVERGVPMLGICRGAQFLWVMNGGKLYQHVDNHFGAHSIVDLDTRVTIDNVSSVHHQMVIPNKNMKVIATATKAKNRWRNPEVNDAGPRGDIEAFFVRDTCCLGIQGHPEYRGYSYFSTWALKQVQKFVVENDDLDWPEVEEGEAARYRRMRPELLVARMEKLKAEMSGDQESAGVLATVSRQVGVN